MGRPSINRSVEVSRGRFVHRSPSLTIVALLSQSSWYMGLTENVQRQVLACAEERGVSAGATLSRHGDTAIHWHGVLEGVLKWSVTAKNGRSVTMGGLSVGSWFGEGSLLHGRPVQAEVVALRHSRVAMVPKEVFDWLYESQPSFNRFLLHQLNERLHWFMGDFAAHRLYAAETVVARALVGLQHPFLHPGAEPHIEISQQEIANLAGLSRQRCNVALRRMKTLGLVRVEYGGITLIDAPGLSRLAVDEGAEPFIPRR